MLAQQGQDRVTGIVRDDIRLIQPEVVEECAKGAGAVVPVLLLDIEKLGIVEALLMDHVEQYWWQQQRR